MSDDLTQVAAQGSAVDESPARKGPLALDGEELAVSARLVAGERVTNAIWGVVIGAGLTIGGGFLVRSGVLPGWLDWLVWIVLLAILAGLVYAAWPFPALQHARLRYAVNERGIEIRKGVWWRTAVNVPRQRVQHTDVEQGPLMRKLGYAKLVIHTAGTQHAKVELPGLEQDRAAQVRDHLIGRGVGHGVERADG
jgi:membrane protein YdbS with pleckstrin-like domain